MSSPTISPKEACRCFDFVARRLNSALSSVLGCGGATDWAETEFEAMPRLPSELISVLAKDPGWEDGESLGLRAGSAVALGAVFVSEPELFIFISTV
jgi:hypothetical protein